MKQRTQEKRFGSPFDPATHGRSRKGTSGALNKVFYDPMRPYTSIEGDSEPLGPFRYVLTRAERIAQEIKDRADRQKRIERKREQREELERFKEGQGW